MVICGIGAVILLLFLVSPIRGRILSRLERLAPGSIVFTIANRRLFGEALALAVAGTPWAERATGLTSAPSVTADSVGLTFWDNTPPERVGWLEWSRVASLEVVDLQTTYRRWSSSAILVHVSTGSGTVAVPLLSPNGTRGMFSSRRESEFLLGRLEAVRSTNVTA
jgi:hypothetical protein